MFSRFLPSPEDGEDLWKEAYASRASGFCTYLISREKSVTSDSDSAFFASIYDGTKDRIVRSFFDEEEKEPFLANLIVVIHETLAGAFNLSDLVTLKISGIAGRIFRARQRDDLSSLPSYFLRPFARRKLSLSPSAGLARDENVPRGVTYLLKYRSARNAGDSGWP